MKEWKDTLRSEIAKGGSEAPCPFCGVPRVKRSDYIRCCRCGVNWMSGEVLDHDPSIQRREIRDALEAATAKRKEPGKVESGREQRHAG